MYLWRIASENRTFEAIDLSGGGAAVNPGRWNDKGEAMVYSGTSIALVTLETCAYIDSHGLPKNRFLIRIEVPDHVWAMREALDPSKLSPAWAAIPAGRTSVRIGSDWLKKLSSPILLVPSVIVPEEFNALINPAHPANRDLTVTVIRPCDYNRLFRDIGVAAALAAPSPPTPAV